jgi:small subunit ribosomal protein S5
MKIKIPSTSCLRRVIPGSVGTANFDSEVACLKRVTNITSGGAVFSLSCLIIVGNYSGFFGIGQASSGEVATAKKKALNQAKKHLFFIGLKDNRTISHSIEGSCGAIKVIMRPAKKGTGIIAPTSVKILLELIGVKDIVVKCHGSSNVRAMILATIDAFIQLKNVKLLSQIRGIKAIDLATKDEDSF